ncbi:MAG: hypothetical protein JNM84_25315 [Planctomycetes bacterium]|nr:hypothetical protein [Planctomycetota bacterium]
MNARPPIAARILRWALLTSLLLPSCGRRSPDLIDRWSAWESAPELLFLAPSERLDEARRAVPRIEALFGKRVRLATSAAPGEEALPRLAWNEFSAPLARPALSFADPRELSAACERFGAAAARDAAVLWVWGHAPLGLAPRYLLVARQLSDVPWDLLEARRFGAPGYQSFRLGDLQCRGALVLRPAGHDFDVVRFLQVAGPRPAKARWRSGRFLIEAETLPSPRQRALLESVLSQLRDPIPRSEARPRDVRLVLHADPQSMSRECGRAMRERAHMGTRTMHWLVGAEPFDLPPLFELQKLILVDAEPPHASSWWIEGLSALLTGDANEFTRSSSWLAALPLIAADPARPRARDLFSEERFARLPRWQRRACSALLVWQALSLGLDVEALRSLKADAPAWPWLADQALDFWCALSLRNVPRISTERLPAFSRATSIEPAFPLGYYDPRFRAALERARSLGFDTVLLVHRGRPLEQEASALPAPLHPWDELAWAVDQARRLGLRVRLRLRYQETRLGAFFGGLWREQGALWSQGFENLDRWMQQQAFAARELDVEAVHLGFELHGVFEPGGREPARLVVPLQRTVYVTSAAAGVPVIFEFKLRERLDVSAFLLPGDAIAVGTRDFLRGFDGLLRNDGKALDPFARRPFVGIARLPSELLSKRARRDRVSRLELSIGIHGHTRIARYAEYPLPQADRDQSLVMQDLLLRTALGNPAVAGFLLEGGEQEGDHLPIELGFADPEVADLLRRRLAVPSAREALRWILPLAL